MSVESLANFRPFGYRSPGVFQRRLGRAGLKTIRANVKRIYGLAARPNVRCRCGAQRKLLSHDLGSVASYGLSRVIALMNDWSHEKGLRTALKGPRTALKGPRTAMKGLRMVT